MSKEQYRDMQLNYYEEEARQWSHESNERRDRVVGSFDDHNNFSGYENLFAGIKDLKNKVCLDFGCGPGRNLVKYHDRFSRIDGVDISPENIKKAKGYLL